MANPISKLRNETMSPESQIRARRKTALLLAEMSLAEARKARHESQVRIAELMNISQPNISQLEKQSDSLISTLKQYAEALGGKLELHIKFDDGVDLVINQYK